MKVVKLLKRAEKWLHSQSKKTYGDRHPWWHFIHNKHHLPLEVLNFCQGNHHFGPQMAYPTEKEVIVLWRHLDRLFIHLLYHHLKPTFKYILSPLCFHLKGPSVIRTVHQVLTQKLTTGEYHFFLRLDIKSYYASINHSVLVGQIKQTLDDPLMHHYLSQIITSAIDKEGIVFRPTSGIPLRSSLSPFFGALYLKPLDLAFEKKSGVFYVRYMDDILILTKTQKQYRQARKTVSRILGALKLKLSKRKSTWGALINKTFHYLGLSYDATQIHRKPKKTQAKVQLHKRSHLRALDKALALTNPAVHPDNLQRYLNRWASWWHLSDKLNQQDNLKTFWWTVHKQSPKDYHWLQHRLSMCAKPA